MRQKPWFAASLLAPLIAAAISVAMIHLLMFVLPVGFDDLLHPLNAGCAALISAYAASRMFDSTRACLWAGVIGFLIALPVYLFAFGTLNLAMLHLSADFAS